MSNNYTFTINFNGNAVSVSKELDTITGTLPRWLSAVIRVFEAAGAVMLILSFSAFLHLFGIFKKNVTFV